MFRWLLLAVFSASIAAAAVFAVFGPTNSAAGGLFVTLFKAKPLAGYQEVPAISTKATGSFIATLNAAETQLSYQLSYSGLEGSVTQASIHFGQTNVNGGIVVFLCQAPLCPASGTVSGTLIAADVIGPAGQGIAAGEFEELLRAMRAGVTYANVHSSLWPGGEIRGQITSSFLGQ